MSEKSEDTGGSEKTKRDLTPFLEPITKLDLLSMMDVQGDVNLAVLRLLLKVPEVSQSAIEELQELAEKVGKFNSHIGELLSTLHDESESIKPSKDELS